MALVNLPSVQKAKTLPEVINIVEKLRKELEFALTQLDGDNMNLSNTWTDLTLINGAAVNNSRTPMYQRQKFGNLITLQGEVQNITGVIATLPVGCRPKQYPLNFKCAMTTGTAVIGSIVNIDTAGNINILANGNTTSGISLANITFVAEQ